AASAGVSDVARIVTKKSVVEGARSLEAHFVPRVRVAHVDLPGDGVRRHVEEHCPDAREDVRLHGGRGRGADREHILVGQGEADGRAPVAPEAILPPARAGVELDDEPRLRTRGALEVRVGRGKATRRGEEPPGGVSDGTWRGARSLVAHRTFGERGRAVAGMEDRRIDRVPIRADRERAWRV